MLKIVLIIKNKEEIWMFAFVSVVQVLIRIRWSWKYWWMWLFVPSCKSDIFTPMHCEASRLFKYVYAGKMLKDWLMTNTLHSNWFLCRIKHKIVQLCSHLTFKWSRSNGPRWRIICNNSWKFNMCLFKILNLSKYPYILALIIKAF